MSDIAKIELSKDLIEPIVRAQLQASITAALGRSDQLVAQVVQTTMNLKVDENGVHSTYHASKPLITWMAEKAIKEAALEALKEWFADNREKLKAQLRKEIEKNSKTMAEHFVLSFSRAVECNYRSSIEIKLGRVD